MKTLFERSRPGRRCTILPALDVEPPQLPAELLRGAPPRLPAPTCTALTAGDHTVARARRPRLRSSRHLRSFPIRPPPPGQMRWIPTRLPIGDNPIPVLSEE